MTKKQFYKNKLDLDTKLSYVLAVVTAAERDVSDSCFCHICVPVRQMRNGMKLAR